MSDTDEQRTASRQGRSSSPATEKMYYVWASKRFEARPGEKCQDHRQRWPQIEGIIQVIGRSLIIVIHFAPLYIILIAEQTHWDWPIITYFAICWSILICLVEIVSLTAPGSFFTLRRFPRLPSKFLSVAEFCALFLTMFNMHEILRPNWRARDEKGRLVADLACPIDTCVTKDEYYGIAVFQCQLVAFIIHLGFFVMAVRHVISRAANSFILKQQQKQLQDAC